MTDTIRKLDDENEFKFSREQGFFDKSLGIRILIGIVFTLSLFAILHFREVRVEILELDSIAPRYIVAQTDLEFYDEEATIISKQEAVRNIGKIYLLSDKNIQQRRTEFENYLVTDDQWRTEEEGRTFDEMYKGVDALIKNLHLLRFTDPRTFQKMTARNLPTSNYFVFSPPKVEIPAIIPPQIWLKIIKSAFPEEQFNPKTVDFISRYFQAQVWEFQEDIPSQRALRRRIQAQVPDKYTHISAGSRIVDQGEKVTSRHIAILQAMKEALSDQRNQWHPLTVSGSMILAVIFTSICAAYFYVNYPQVISSNRKLFLLVTVIILTFGIAKFTEFFFLTSKTNLIEVIRYPLFIPFSAILLCCLLNPAIAAFTSGFLTIILMISLAFDWQGFVIMNLSAALVAILCARNLRQRKEIFVICAKAWLCCIGVIISIHLYQNTHWDGLLTDILSSGGFMLLTAVLVVGLLPLLESSFHIMTDVTLMEYMDPNHDLLRRLSIEAPGSYQHSVVVGNLAEAAALAIGANGLFCRVSTLYHDIGKMATPQYFTENQHGGMNIHQLLTPQESAHVIIDHVAEGVAMARKAGLPEQFIDIIKEHHGTTLAYYFYRKQLELVDNDKSKFDEKDFRYMGPKPRSKESAIIMIADSVEAASRSLDKVSQESLMELTESIVKEKYEDGQFDHSQLTLEELAIVKETLARTLVAYGHSRIKYPKRERGEQPQKEKVKKKVDEKQA
ncbi:MAG: Cyclic-di-AMP phosphodiesterase PgpH [Chlamydiae bacterium]|nr:Cyclic-di-AMP phosphodiesterase PgpH [Chlamydiota bacterium]